MKDGSGEAGHSDRALISLPVRAADCLASAAAAVGDLRVVAGFDGLVDTIIHVVDTRTSATEYTRVTAMGEFARRVGEAAGLSANVEFVNQLVKLGGNGPIFSAALAALGPKLTYIGSLGDPEIHPVFVPFASLAEIHSLAEPGYTDALEFDDGKLMCGNHEGLRKVRWSRILEVVSLEFLVKKIQAASLIGLVNWTMLPHMTEILENFLIYAAPRISGPKRWAFFDLADPAKRAREDLRWVLALIRGFEEFFHVILGLNLQEARQVAEVLGLDAGGKTAPEVARLADRIRRALDVSNVVIHPAAFAAAADRQGCEYVPGPFTLHPKITTGAGDHFNAGFCYGRLAKLGLRESLQIGVATSGYYVRQAESPGVSELSDFLHAIAREPV